MTDMFKDSNDHHYSGRKVSFFFFSSFFFPFSFASPPAPPPPSLLPLSSSRECTLSVKVSNPFKIQMLRFGFQHCAK